MNSEPTVLDFVKAILTPWRGAPPRIPPLESPDILETDSIDSSGLPPSQLNGNVVDRAESSDLSSTSNPDPCLALAGDDRFRIGFIRPIVSRTFRGPQLAPGSYPVYIWQQVG